MVYRVGPWHVAILVSYQSLKYSRYLMLSYWMIEMYFRQTGCYIDICDKQGTDLWIEENSVKVKILLQERSFDPTSKVKLNCNGAPGNVQGNLDSYMLFAKSFQFTSFHCIYQLESATWESKRSSDYQWKITFFQDPAERRLDPTVHLTPLKRVVWVFYCPCQKFV